MISVFRFVLPDAQIKVAGGREVNLRELQSWMFFAGASGCLVGDYLLTKGRSAADDRQMLSDLELPVVSEHTGLAHEVKA
jgi:biotin synthase